MLKLLFKGYFSGYVKALTKRIGIPSKKPYITKKDTNPLKYALAKRIGTPQEKSLNEKDRNPLKKTLTKRIGIPLKALTKKIQKG